MLVSGSVSWSMFLEKQKKWVVNVSTRLSTREFLCMTGRGEEKTKWFM